MAPTFERAAPQLEPEIRLAKVDIDAVGDLATRFAVQSIPTLLLVRHGREIARAMGVMALPQLLAWARQHAGGIAA
jgi:thioredoxin 2